MTNNCSGITGYCWKEGRGEGVWLCLQARAQTVRKADDVTHESDSRLCTREIFATMIGENTDTHYLQEERGKRCKWSRLTDLKRKLKLDFEIPSSFQWMSRFSVSSFSSLHSRWELFTKCNGSLVRRHMETISLAKKKCYYNKPYFSFHRICLIV